MVDMGSGLNNQIAEIVTNVLLASLVAIVGMATAWLNKRRRWADTQTKQHDLELFGQIARAAVGAVEQISTAQGWDGSAKLAEATRRAQQIAAKHGVQFSDAQLHTLIEDAVLALKQGVTLVQSATVTPDPTSSQTPMGTAPIVAAHNG